jgi:plasmid stabilization system protein ParE
MLSVRLLDAARQEITDAAKRYREEAPELARDFRDEVKRTVMHARRFPQGGPVIAQIEEVELRHFLLRPRFPFMVIACQVERELVVFAVAHQSQEPGYWRPRLAKVLR